MQLKKDQNPGNPADTKYETVTRTYDNQKEGEPYITAEFSKTDAGTTFDVGDEKYYSRVGISTEAKRKRRALPRKLDIQLFRQRLSKRSVKAYATVACVAVVSVSFQPSGASARGHWAKGANKCRSRGEGRGRKGKETGVPFLPPPPRLLLFFFCSFCKMPSRVCHAWLKGNGNDCYAG